MHLIQFSYQVNEAEQEAFREIMEDAVPFFEDRGFPFVLFQDTQDKTKFLQVCQSEESVDVLVELIQNDEEMRKHFESIRDLTSNIHIAYYQQLL